MTMMVPRLFDLTRARLGSANFRLGFPAKNKKGPRRLDHAQVLELEDLENLLADWNS